MNKELEFLERLMCEIVEEGAKTPKAQVERYLSPILSIFLEEILNKSDILTGTYEMIAPEFPIRKGTIAEITNEVLTRPNQSTNIDYLLLNKDGNKNKFSFIELKTDPKSFKPSQLEIYNNLEKVCNTNTKVFGEILYEDLEIIKTKSSYKKKYNYLLQNKWRAEYNEIDKMEIVYIVPAETKLKDSDPSLKVIYFDDIDKILKGHHYASQWKTIVKYLVKLDSKPIYD